MSVIELVKSLISAIENVQLLWRPLNYNENDHEIAKWVDQVIMSGSWHMTSIPPTIETFVIHNSFAPLVE